MIGDRPPPRRRARISDLGKPLNGEPFEIGPVDGTSGEPIKVRAYIVDRADIDFVGAEDGGPAPVDYPAALDIQEDEQPTAEKDTDGDGDGDKAKGDSKDGRPRIGWSLVIAAISDTTMGVAAIVTGSTVIGIVSSVAVGACSIVLVVSEVASFFERRS